ncbi:MAG: membrane protein insertase YidC [Kiritimatiellae bacterium]|nr:membrane protein insertase YidC [Kiritimatiellia bacterium]
MTKRDLPIFFVLLALILLLPAIDRRYIAPLFRKPVAPAEPLRAAGEPNPATRPAGVGTSETPELGAATVEETPAVPPMEVTISNDVLALTFHNRGGGLLEAVVLRYPMTPDPTSGPVRLDFRASPALVYEGLRGLGESALMTVRGETNSTSARLVFERGTAQGLRLRRTVELPATGYQLRIVDTFRNDGTSAVAIAEAWIRLGEMGYLPGESRTAGMEFLGVDSLSPGEPVTYWGRRLPGFFHATQGETVPATVAAPLLAENRPAEWVAVKNKYFVQILKPEDRFEKLQARLRREVAPGEGRKPKVRLASVGAAAKSPSRTLEPGEAWSQTYELFVGPKKYDVLRELDAKRVDVLEFGRFGGIAKLLLRALNAFYGVIPNYGVAILLLTLLIRVLFWPLTHKSTESMKRMQALAPQIKELQAKYRDNPQRLNRETLELYRRHKVNPLSGCLPILVQLPVLFALFVVLRGAIELRFASFLWIRDLSEPENLLQGMLPFGLSLNPLPIVMTALQVWQTKLTPSAGDPAQQKMFLFMPVLMLFFFYSFPSGLVLYWTVNQALMIGQLVRRRVQSASAAGGAS